MKFLPFISAFLFSTTVQAADISGTASVIDGDTIDIHGQRIRLHGIDCPEGRQRCYIAGKPWACGTDAANALADQIGRAPVSCQPRDVDRYGRVVAICRSRGTNLNAWMVENGWAVAYRHYSLDYVAAENRARSAKRGIWASQFEMPWDWRRSR
ncbi:thermonuclease family protein [Paenirhodobacter hankyongi]|uniref:Thermonuclease family protein n=1 Tax=Paenirhodobacter hankyongi TaxID=2294033 RepID=A0A421BJV1_9RHOB|nr:thermonuclease family protein [Sinirhodobacter hankyongi]RLL62810.1 thermonuclease family protein [Sinirhodobacter hankyongi]